ncbi:LysE family translocator [Microbulbifer taiwanensis]|uniref:LysE family translocator n=1 Tax=Microbulbifer taiwanensis TaxID=986746 RepID=UPI00361247C2
MGAIPGILGISGGMLCIATISATTLAAILAASAMAFTIFKFIGAAYLIYLGIKMWRLSSTFDLQIQTKQKSHKLRFAEGFLITLLNPKPIFFFMALFPQFITPSENYQAQFIALALTFSFLVVIVHCTYAIFLKAAKSGLSTPRGSKLISRVSGSFYMVFGVGLATSHKSV